MVIPLPNPSLLLLIGPSGSGKSAFARRHFRATEVLSSDFCRALVCDDEANQSATNDAFDILYQILFKRLQRRRLTVIDATNVQASSRAKFAEAAKEFHVPLLAIVFALPEAICQARNLHRTHRQVAADVIKEQFARMAELLPILHLEGFDAIYKLQTVEEVEPVKLVRAPYS